MIFFIARPDKEQKEIKKKKPKQKQEKVKAEEDDEEGWEVVPHRSALHRELTEKDKMKLLFGKDKVEIEVDVIAKKRDQMVETKGKKVSDRLDHVKMIQYLLDISDNAGLGVFLPTSLIQLIYHSL